MSNHRINIIAALSAIALFAAPSLMAQTSAATDQSSQPTASSSSSATSSNSNQSSSRDARQSGGDEPHATDGNGSCDLEPGDVEPDFVRIVANDFNPVGGYERGLRRIEHARGNQARRRHGRTVIRRQTERAAGAGFQRQ